MSVILESLPPGKKSASPSLAGSTPPPRWIPYFPDQQKERKSNIAFVLYALYELTPTRKVNYNVMH